MFILPLCVAGQFGPTRFVHDWYMHFIAKVVQEYFRDNMVSTISKYTKK